MMEKYSSESSSKEEQSLNNSITDFPKFSASTDTTVSQKCFENVIASDEVIELNKSLGDDCIEVSIEHQENITVNQLQEMVIDFQNENVSPEKLLNSLAEKKTSNSEIHSQIMRQLVTLNARSKEHGEYLHTMMMMINDIKEKFSNSQLSTNTSSGHEFDQIYKVLPVSSEEYLNELQHTLTNILHDKTVKMLSLIGGSSLNESIRRVLRKLITIEFAKTFSYTGHKSNKIAFNKTILSSLLTNT